MVWTTASPMMWTWIATVSPISPMPPANLAPPCTPATTSWSTAATGGCCVMTRIQNRPKCYLTACSSPTASPFPRMKTSYWLPKQATTASFATGSKGRKPAATISLWTTCPASLMAFRRTAKALSGLPYSAPAMPFSTASPTSLCFAKSPCACPAFCNPKQ